MPSLTTIERSHRLPPGRDPALLFDVRQIAVLCIGVLLMVTGLSGSLTHMFVLLLTLPVAAAALVGLPYLFSALAGRRAVRDEPSGPLRVPITLIGPRAATSHIIRLSRRPAPAGVFSSTPLDRDMASTLLYSLGPIILMLMWARGAWGPLRGEPLLVALAVVIVVLTRWAMSYVTAQVDGHTLVISRTVGGRPSAPVSVDLTEVSMQCDLCSGQVLLKGAHETIIDLRDLLRPNAFVAALIAAVRVDEAGTERTTASA